MILTRTVFLRDVQLPFELNVFAFEAFEAPGIRYDPDFLSLIGHKYHSLRFPLGVASVGPAP